MFPIVSYESGMQLEDMCYLVASNGTFLYKNTGLYKTVVPVTEIPFQEAYTGPKFELTLPSKIPAIFVHRIQLFFKEVVRLYGAEACTVLLYNKATDTWQIQIPKQKVSGSAVHYDREPTPPGFLTVGTIHSHANFSAFHSSTDDHDEENFDGIHCTFGDNSKEAFSISASVVVNASRFMLNPVDVLDGIEATSNPKMYKLIAPNIDELLIQEWLKQVEGR